MKQIAGISIKQEEVIGNTNIRKNWQGRVATGSTIEETEKNMYEAIEFYLEGFIEDNIPIPESSSIAGYIVLL